MRYCSDRFRREWGNCDQKFQFYKVFMKSHIAGSASADTTRMCKNWNAIMYNLTKLIKKILPNLFYIVEMEDDEDTFVSIGTPLEFIEEGDL